MVEQKHRWVAGIDGCPAGWLVVFVALMARETRLRILPRFERFSTRRRIRLSSPSTFPSACRSALPREAAPLSGSCGAIWAGGSHPYSRCLRARRSRRLTTPRPAPWRSQRLDPPRKISRQLFMIAPKIREVDAVLMLSAGGEPCARIHPELAFWRLNGERALDQPKKIKGRCYGPGLALRRQLLIEAGYASEVVNTRPPRGAGEDDDP